MLIVKTVVVHKFTDTEDPVINNTPEDVTVPTDADSAKAIVTWKPPVASDNFGSVSLLSSHNPGDSFALGTTLVTYTATDAANHRAKDSFNVIVIGTITWWLKYQTH